MPYCHKHKICFLFGYIFSSQVTWRSNLSYPFFQIRLFSTALCSFLVLTAFWLHSHIFHVISPGLRSCLFSVFSYTSKINVIMRTHFLTPAISEGWGPNGVTRGTDATDFVASSPVKLREERSCNLKRFFFGGGGGLFFFFFWRVKILLFFLTLCVVIDPIFWEIF